MIVDLLAAFERGAARGPDIDRGGAPETIRRSILENSADIAKLEGELLSPETGAALRSAQLTFLEVHRDRFEERVREGRVRDGHGDIRAEHVVLAPEPAVMDCVEFNERFRHIDAAADVAFLRMDLEFLGHERLARSFLDGCIEATRDPGMRGVLGLHVVYRACVRGKVDGIKSRQEEVEPAERERAADRARRYFDLALAHARALDPPLLVLVGGFSGSGKSTVARLLGERLGTAPIRSDVIRKELAGLRATDRPMDQAGRAALYSREMGRRTYAECAARAERLLKAGGTAIIDATFLRESERDAARERAAAAGARLVYLECRVPLDLALQRLRRREADGGDPSDATVDVLEAQVEAREPPLRVEPVPLGTEGPPERVLEAALDAIRARAAG
jgi:predicted kinase